LCENVPIDACYVFIVQQKIHPVSVKLILLWKASAWA